MSFSMTITRPMCLFNCWTHAREIERSREKKETDQEKEKGVMWWILMKTHRARTTKVHACRNTNFTWEDSSLERSYTRTCRTIATDLEGCGKKNPDCPSSTNHTNNVHILPTHHTALSSAKAVSYQHPPNAVSKTGLNNHKDTACVSLITHFTSF